VAAVLAFAVPRSVCGQDFTQLFRQFTAYRQSGQIEEAHRLAQQVVQLAEEQQNPTQIGRWSSCLGLTSSLLGRYDEAERLLTRALTIHEKAPGPNNIELALDLHVLGLKNSLQGRLEEAESLLKRAIGTVESAPKSNQGMLALCIHALGCVYLAQGRLVEAEQTQKRALRIQEASLGPDHQDLVMTLVKLGEVYMAQGRFAEAENLIKRALPTARGAQGDRAQAPDIVINRLASLYMHQGRFAEAEPLLERLVQRNAELRRPDHLRADDLQQLGELYSSEGRFEKAETLLQQALAIKQKYHGIDSFQTATLLGGLANLYMRRHQFSRAEPLLRKMLTILEKSLGKENQFVADGLVQLARVYVGTDRLPDAKPLLDRAVSIAERIGSSPSDRYAIFFLRGLIAWMAGRRDEALGDLREALLQAEDQRGWASGAERERSGVFAKFASGFETMVACQMELGNPDAAFNAIERSHARSLLDEIRMADADLDAGRPAGERERLRRAESELSSRVANLEWRLGRIEPKAQSNEFQRIQAELAQARLALYAHRRDERNSNPIYRELITRKTVPPDLGTVQRRLIGPGDLMLVYLLGEEGGYITAITRDSARLIPLKLEPDGASALGVAPGPLTTQRLFDALITAKGTGVTQQLTDPGSEAPAAKLAALWRTLVPEPERAALTAGKVKRLIVVPDGPLALLPFEALVVEGDKEPEYLLDAGPTITYSPSAAVLLNLIDRPTVPSLPDREPVLALGDPAYPGNDPGQEEAARTGLLTTRSRYGIAGGKLARLPHSGVEAQWVADCFTEAGVKAGVLSGTNATERAVRYWAPGRRVLHLACHGMADAAYGNYFGAMALTPGPSVRADDDGFLTLAEICELNLKGCELAILSACQTNYGPQQKGEGTWALSRGFLVAGARRVVASNWLVDDEAAASLVSRFCGGLAQAEKAGNTIDYAGSLQDAKRWVRKQEKWKSPYYWASLVLVGPP